MGFIATLSLEIYVPRNKLTVQPAPSDFRLIGGKKSRPNPYQIKT